MRQNTIDLTVHWGDTDMAGIIYYPNYFHWFDIGSHRLFNKIGIRPKEMMFEEKIGLPIIDVGCTFYKPLYYNDEIRITSKITEVSEKTFRVEHEVYRGEELTGKGYELRGWVKFTDGKLRAVPISEDARRKMLAEDMQPSA